MEPYNSLKDPHLSGYFSNDLKKNHIIKAGLLSRQGELISESTYKLNSIMAEKKFQMNEKQNRRYKILPRVNMPSEDFCRQLHQPPKFMSAGGNTRPPNIFASPDRVKSAPDYLKLKPYSTSLLPPHPFSKKLPLTSSFKSRPTGSFSTSWKPPNIRGDVIKLQVSADKQEYSGYVSFKSLPLIKGGESVGKELKLSGTLKLLDGIRSSYGKTAKLCLVTMRYHGDNVKLMDRWCSRMDEVAVEQQLAGGGAAVVFREMLPHGATFTFESRRQAGQAFSLTLYVNRCMNGRISVCCEGKHKKGSRLGGSSGMFSLLQVKNPFYCQSCSEKKRKRKGKRKKRLSKEKGKNSRSSSNQSHSDDDDYDDDEDDVDEVESDYEMSKEKDNRKSLDAGEDVETAVERDGDKNYHRRSKKQRSDDDYSSDCEEDAKCEEKKKKKKSNKKKREKKEDKEQGRAPKSRHHKLQALKSLRLPSGKGRVSGEGEARGGIGGVLNGLKPLNLFGRDDKGRRDSDEDSDRNNDKDKDNTKDKERDRDSDRNRNNHNDKSKDKYSDKGSIDNDDDDYYKYRNNPREDVDGDVRNSDNEASKSDRKKSKTKRESKSDKEEEENMADKNRSDKDDGYPHGEDDYERNIDDVTRTLIGSVYRSIEREEGRHGSFTDESSEEEEA